MVILYCELQYNIYTLLLYTIKCLYYTVSYNKMSILYCDQQQNAYTLL